MSPYSVAKSCLILYNPMDCSPPGSSDHGILQARILVAIVQSSLTGVGCRSLLQGIFLTQGSNSLPSEPPAKLSEISQPPKDKYCMIPFPWGYLEY